MKPAKKFCLIVLALAAPFLVLFLVFWAISYFESSAAPKAYTETVIIVDEERIDEYIRVHRVLPKSLAELPQSDGKIDGGKDGWDRPIVYTIGTNGVVTLASLGSDGKPGGSGDASDLVQSYPTKDAEGNWITNRPIPSF